MKVWKRLYGAMLAASLLSAPSLMAQTLPTAHADPQSIEESIVLVGIEWTGTFRLVRDDGSVTWTQPVTVSGHCTGFVVGNAGEIATAGHCVSEEGIKRRLARKLIQVLNNPNLDPESAQDVLMESEVLSSQDGPPLLDGRLVQVIQPPEVENRFIDRLTTVNVAGSQSFDDGDVALLRIPNMSKKMPALRIGDTLPQVGDEVTSIGFPGSVADVVDVTRLRPSHKRGTVSSIQSTEKAVSVIEIDADVSQGMSGGPAINAAGEVIGLNSFGNANESQSFNFITNGADLRRFLIDKGVTLPQAPAAPSPAPQISPSSNQASDNGFSVPIWGYVIGLLALVVAIGFGTKALLKRQTPAPAQGFNPGVGYPNQPYQPSMTPMTAELPQSCPRCHSDVPPGAQFCANCGQPLS